MRARWLAKLLARALIPPQRDPDRNIGQNANGVYMKRWHLIPRNRFLNVYLHHFLQSDDDRALHDHPWSSLSILLKGAGMLEHLPQGRIRYIGPGDIVYRAPEHAHRLELLRNIVGSKHAHEEEVLFSFRNEKVWTLFITGKVVRSWGFHCPQGWKHWRDYTSGTHGEIVGRGCGLGGVW